MFLITPMLSWLRAQRRRRELEAEMHEEMHLHLEQRTEEYIKNGLTREAAARAAAIGFGPQSLFNDQAREARGWAWIDALFRNLRYAQRQLASAKLFSAVTIGSLSLFLGINAAAFAVLDALVLRPLPFPQADRIVEVYNSFANVGVAKFCSNVGQYLDFKANVSAFETAALWEMHQDSFADADHASLLVTAAVTPEFFEMLGAHPVAGRFFDASYDRNTAPHVVVLTDSFWASRFQRDLSVVGKTLQLNAEEYEIIGVAPAALEKFAPQVQALRPLTWDHTVTMQRSGYSPMLLARLKPGFTANQAEAQALALEKKFVETSPAGVRAFVEQTGQTVQVDRLIHQRAQAFEKPLGLLQAAAIAVLLVAFANILNLFIARINAREMEFKARAALGASRNDLIFQLAIESSVIGILGLIGGFAVASAALNITNHFVAVLSPNTASFQLQPPVVAVTIAAALTLIVLITLFTSGQVLRAVFVSLKESGARAQSSSVQSRRLANCFLVGQIAFALIISITAVLLVQSFFRAASVSPGFNPDHVLALRLAVPESKEHTLPARFEEALRKLPGMECCVVTTAPFYLVPPVNASMPLGALHVRGQEASQKDSLPSAYNCGVTANYAAILGIRMLRGRWFTDADIASGKCVVVDETFWKRYFPTEDPIGQKIVINRGAPSNESDWQEIIGVASNVLHNGIGDTTGQPFVYLSRDHTHFYGAASIIVKTDRPAEEALQLIRAAVAAVDPGIPTYDNKSMRELMADSIEDRRALMLLLLTLAGSSVFLASLGIYGSLSYDVSRRVREIGIRTAIGATKANVVKLLVNDARRRAFFGVAIGLIGCLLCSPLVSSLLFKSSSRDIFAYAATAAVLFFLCLLASLIPALRASRLDPVAALRAE